MSYVTVKCIFSVVFKCSKYYLNYIYLKIYDKRNAIMRFVVFLNICLFISATVPPIGMKVCATVDSRAVSQNMFLPL